MLTVGLIGLGAIGPAAVAAGSSVLVGVAVNAARTEALPFVENDAAVIKIFPGIELPKA